MKYAIVQYGSSQYKVQDGDIIKIEGRGLASDANKLTLDKVLMTSDDSGVQVGHPYLEGAQVELEIIGEKAGRKGIVFKKKRRKGYRKKTGYRARYTVAKVLSISGTTQEKKFTKY